MLPSQYLRRQIWAAFLDDPVYILLASADNRDAGFGFPHSDPTWPNSRDVIAKNFAEVPDPVRHKMTCRNAARLYGIDLGQEK